MAQRRKKARRDIENYAHTDKERVNNPPVGLVTPQTDRDGSNKPYAHDPHLDPHLSWAGKAEDTSFEVSTVSLHVHERIDPRTIIEAVRKERGTEVQASLFSTPEENPPLRQAIEFYRHRHNWTNRLIAGDSLLVMNSLIEKEGLEGQVQMVYIDPPYGIRYRSNFQPFVNQREVTDGRSNRGQNPGRKSSNYLQGCTICVSCRCPGPCWTVPRKRENRSQSAGVPRLIVGTCSAPDRRD